MLRSGVLTLLNRSQVGWHLSRCYNCGGGLAVTTTAATGTGGVFSEQPFKKLKTYHHHAYHQLGRDCSRMYSTNVASVESIVKDNDKVRTTLVDAILESITPEDTAKVLKLVNEVERSEDLVKYFIPKKKADELIKMKSLKGDGNPISSLEDIVTVVGPKNSPKFFCSILDRPIPMSIHSAIFPLVTSEDIKRISNAVSVVIVGDKISWSLVKRSYSASGVIKLNVESLNQVAYQFKPRMHILSLLKEMETVAKQIPNSELCITEEYPVTVPTPYMFNFQLQMAQAKSLLLGLLSSRPNPPTMISIKTIAVGRLFNTFVGSERVSGQHIVEDMLLHNRLECIDIQNSTLDNYISLDSKIKEGMSHTFLLNMSYWKLTKQLTLS